MTTQREAAQLARLPPQLHPSVRRHVQLSLCPLSTATCHAPSGRPATCHTPTGRPATWHAPTDHPPDVWRLMASAYTPQMTWKVVESQLTVSAQIRWGDGPRVDDLMLATIARAPLGTGVANDSTLHDGLLEASVKYLRVGSPVACYFYAKVGG